MFDPDNLLPDRALRAPITLDVQGFLEQVGSPLARQLVGGTAIARILEGIAREVGIDVRILLTKLQVEQSLLTGEATPDRLDWALGYGVTDSGRMEHYRGFETQVRMAARTLVGYLDGGDPLTVVGQVGKSMKVSDGVVLPRTLATAALYRYTPWIGLKKVADLEPPFGNYLFYLVWTEFFGTEPQDEVGEGWRLIAPQDNWRNPLPLSEEVVPVLKEVARRLGLLVGEDVASRKLYLGQPRGLSASVLPRTPSSTASTLDYPSGRSLRRVTLQEIGAQEAERYLPARAGKAAPLVEVEPDTQISEHFRLHEFLPRDSSYRLARVSPPLVELLEALRADLGGVPLQVNSGYRPPAYNQAVGGASSSLHLDGLAADISSPQVSFSRLAEAADRLVGDRGGVGLYRSQDFVHVDLRGERARWP